VTVIFGILNTTPDSFSDGGTYLDHDVAVERGLALAEAGADFVDVGGESTRPGAERVPEDVEHERVLPVIEDLAARGVAVSVDTMRASTARLAVSAGARVINDVSGGLADPEMHAVVAEHEVDYVAMDWAGLSHEVPDYDNVVRHVRDQLKLRVAELIVHGVNPSRIIVDPGIGFAKTAEQNWQLLGHVGELATLDTRVLIGVSRKRFLAPFAPEGAPADERDEATAIISALAAQAGVWGVRVHDVASTRRALDVWHAWQRGAAS
jgi:dihydropteroate synthase